MLQNNPKPSYEVSKSQLQHNANISTFLICFDNLDTTIVIVIVDVDAVVDTIDEEFVGILRNS